MAEVDHFVFLDDVQLSRQSWQTRNRVLMRGKVHWIVVPIAHGGLEQTICDTEIAGQARWRRKLARSLRQSYARHPAIGDLGELLDQLETGKEERLADLNVALIAFCATRLGIATPCRCSTSMTIASRHRTGRLIEFCERLDCDTYLSPPGSADYLEADGFRVRGRIRLEYAHYEPPPYPQHGGGPFILHPSIVDVIANLGWDGAARYIRAPWPALGKAQ